MFGYRVAGGRVVKEESFGRKLSFFDAVMLVMGGIIGVGIFFTPRDVAALVPEPAVFLGMWVLGALVALCGGLTFAELGGSFPRAGGWFVFLREAFGPFVAFLFAWVILGVVSTGGIAVIATIGANNLGGLGDWAPSGTLGHVALAASFIVILTILTLCGIKMGANVQNFCMVSKLIAIAALVVAGIVFFTPGAEPVAPPPVVTSEPGQSLLRRMTTAFLPVFFAFGGWANICYIAPQVKNPQRAIPRAILLGVTAVALIYLAINITYLRVLGIDELARNQEFAADVAERVFGEGGRRALKAAIAVSAFGVCAVNIIVSPGIYVAMAREGLFFRSFGRLNRRTGAPVLALLTQCVLALGYLTWSHAGVFVEISSDDAMDPSILTKSVVFAEWIFHTMAAGALLLMRASRPDLPRPFRSWAYPLAPVLYLLIAAAVVLGNVRWDYQTLIGGGVIVVGAAVYRPWRWFMRRGAAAER